MISAVFYQKLLVFYMYNTHLTLIVASYLLNPLKDIGHSNAVPVVSSAHLF